MERPDWRLPADGGRPRRGDLLVGVLRRGAHFRVRRRHHRRVGGPERAGGEGGGGEEGGELAAAGRAEDPAGRERRREGAEAGDQAGAAEERAQDAAAAQVRRARPEGGAGQGEHDEGEDAHQVRRRVEHQQQDVPRGAGGAQVPRVDLHLGAAARNRRDGGELEGADSVHGQALRPAEQDEAAVRLRRLHPLPDELRINLFDG